MGSLEVSCDESSSDANESSKSASCHDIDRKSTDVLDNYEPLPKYRRVDEDSDTNPDSVPECHRVGANLYKLSSAMSEAVEDLRQCGDTGVNSLTAAPFACSLCLGILHDDWLKRMTSVVSTQLFSGLSIFRPKFFIHIICMAHFFCVFGVLMHATPIT